MGDDETFVIQNKQEITDDFLSATRDARNASTQGRMGDYHRFASIPTIIVEKWMREGFNVFEQPAKEIIARLKNEDLSAFLTSERSL